MLVLTVLYVENFCIYVRRYFNGLVDFIKTTQVYLYMLDLFTYILDLRKV